MEIPRGYRGLLAEGSQGLSLSFDVSGPEEYDVCCFAVDASEKLCSDDYMVFYNQPAAPGNAIVMKEKRFLVHFARLPDFVSKLVFTVSVDGAGTIGQISWLDVTIQPDGEALHFHLPGQAFGSERAIVALELYRRGGWRLNAVGRGFSGGLPDLLRAYGGEEESRPPDQPEPDPPHKAVEKPDLKREAPDLLALDGSLCQAMQELKLAPDTSRVSLSLDISGSMLLHYRSGLVQKIVRRLFPLAIELNPKRSMDLWYYAAKPERMQSVTLSGYKAAVPEDFRKLMYALGGARDECAAMEEVAHTYQASLLPVLALFVTGGNISARARILDIVEKTGELPVFWQFVGVNGRNYGPLERLASSCQNAAFFAVDSFEAIDSGVFYRQLLSGYCKWHAE